MIGCCGCKIGACGWYDTSTVVVACGLVHCDASAGMIAPVSARTPTQVDDCVREPHAPAELQHVGHGVHCPVLQRYVVHGGTLGHGCDCGMQFEHWLDGTDCPAMPLTNDWHVTDCVRTPAAPLSEHVGQVVHVPWLQTYVTHGGATGQGWVEPWHWTPLAWHSWGGTARPPGF